MHPFIYAIFLAVAFGYGWAFGVAYSVRDTRDTCAEKHITVIASVPYRCTFEEIKE